MGQAILYCFRCSTQLREAHFEKGKAFRLDAWVTCADCAPELAKSLPPDRVQALLNLIAGKDRKATQATPPPMRDSRLSITPAAFPQAGSPAPPKPRWPLFAGIGLLLAALLLAAVVMGRSSDARPAPAAEEASTPAVRPPPPVVRPPPPPGESSERQTLLKARKFAQEHPDDVEGQLREYGDLTLLSDKTEVGAEARKAVEDLHARERQTVAKGLLALNAEIDGPLEREEFGAVLKTIESAKSRIAGTQWKLAVERREREVGELLYAAFQLMKEKAKIAKAAGNKADLDALFQKAKIYGDKRPGELEEAIAGVGETPPPVPEEPTRSAEAKGYLAQWELAMTRASSRDYSGAVADLERAGAALKEDAVKKEFAKDLRDLKELDRLFTAAIAAQSGARSLTLKTADGKSVAGRVLAIDADRVELYVDPVKPTVFVEWSEIAAATLAAFLKPLNSDVRLSALFALLDGDQKAFRAGIDPKYGLYARDARTKSVKPGSDEMGARELYYDAERQFRKMASREKAIEEYRLLKQKFKDTQLVRRAAARIDRRCEAGKEYYLAASDLAFAGSFAMTKEARLESMADADPAKPAANFVEWEFLSLPSTSYHCWALVGGCCAETFTFHFQATGHTEMNPKTKKRGPAEPGGELASPVKHSIRNLKATHPKGEPQKPTRWEWVEIVLPRSAAPGVKKVRLITEQQGFGVAAVLISSTKSRAPTEAEVAELVRMRALDAVPAWAGSANPLRFLMEDFEQGIAGWSYHGGNEFPGAKGLIAHDPAVGHEQKGSLRLNGDFRGGGSYVSCGRTLPPGRDFKEVRFWLKSDNAVHLGVRIGDGSDQCHQKPLALAATKDWQEVVLTFEKFAGGEHWGGANDGKWHGPAKWFHICVSTTTFGGSKAGDVWIDDLEGILNFPDGDR